MKIVLILPLFLLVFSLYCNSQDYKLEYQKAQVKLESLNKELHSIYKKNPAFLRALDENIKAWNWYKQTQFDLQFPNADTAANPKATYGSIYPTCANHILLDLTNKRIESLQPWLKGVNEGELCAGSIKINY